MFLLFLLLVIPVIKGIPPAFWIRKEPIYSVNRKSALYYLKDVRNENLLNAILQTYIP
ncbi:MULTISPECIES: hypothetical protein [Bacillus amyloliquefaciens group]|uniref:hypothetical protein n=1 Tax=Bacillus amyloliquefaciens group TaxID=1938374 RepID=UPI001362F7F0|nr:MULTISPECIES: hypothetical protein [Bacillus amyloliquefaciens group]MBO3651738.1 hypothetical protein [Bacillus amyloliquefaciens]MCJ2175333.1 hypothetical protein [Bacillus amyloliquefaciens]MCR4349704.1 hypothetical protein [Bacillus amyloliquefaciens]MCR4357757.1 hypothetical protein [Bacillus amyloliquefaciens]QHM80434.1 hypothetical protein DBK22_02300 [Bacillus velezensis]